MSLSKMKCQHCKMVLDDSDAYEYRGTYACAEHFDMVCKSRDSERAEITREESQKANIFKGLDLTDSSIGKANRQILKTHIEVASKESGRIKKYEGR